MQNYTCNIKSYVKMLLFIIFAFLRQQCDWSLNISREICPEDFVFLVRFPVAGIGYSPEWK